MMSCKKYAIFLIFPTLILSLHKVEFFRWLDYKFFDERIKDYVGAIYFKEDWNATPVINAESWGNRIEQRELYVAHALGGSGESNDNSFEALDTAIQLGFNIFEVDIWLDSDGKLRCHHGPGLPPKETVNSCTYNGLIKKIEKNNFILILDIKTDFKSTGDLLVKQTPFEVSKNVVFQLYEPKHFSYFIDWQRSKKFPFPLVTLYRSKRSIKHVLTALNKKGVTSFVVPSKLLNNIDKSSNLTLFTHPVHSCSQYLVAREKSVVGFFINNSIFKDVKNGCI